MSVALTDISIAAIKPRDKRFNVSDGKTPGLILVVYPTATKTFRYRFSYAGRDRELTIGNYPLPISLAQARKAATEAAFLVSKGIDPCEKKQEEIQAVIKATEKRQAVKKEKKKHLIENIVDLFINRPFQKTTEKHQYDTKRTLEKEIVGAWRGRDINSITGDDIEALLFSIGGKIEDERATRSPSPKAAKEKTKEKADDGKRRPAPATANKVHSYGKQLFHWARKKDYLKKDEWEKFETAPYPTTPRDRWLEAWEIKLLWQATRVLKFPYKELVQLMLFTGQREGALAKAFWSEVHFKDRIWQFPRLIIKRQRAHEIPLTAPMIDILKSLPKFESALTASIGEETLIFSDSEYVPANFSDSKVILDLEIARLNDGKPIKPWVFHDLRRTASTHMISMGISPLIADLILNNASAGKNNPIERTPADEFNPVARIYNQWEYREDKKKGLEMLARHYTRIINGESETNVVSLAGTRTGRF